MRKKNVLMTALSLTLVGVIAAGGTLAYLTSQSSTLTNTFTVGEGYGTEEDPGFYLDETATTTTGEGETVNPTQISEDNRTKSGNTYAAMSIGDTITKDPTFHLVKGPESYIFAKVTGVDAMEAEKIGFDFEGWSNKWVKITADGEDDERATYDGYYRYNDTVTAGTEIDPMFTTVSLPDELTALPGNNDLNNVTVKGVAVQAANLETLGDAWDVAKTKF